jgi:molybdate transport system substrate-binding protein
MQSLGIMRRTWVPVAAVLALAGCGGGGDSPRPTLTVSAAASLTEALTRCSPGFTGARVRLSFAGSDELAAQIRQGARVDVFAAANTKLPDALHAAGLVRAPRAFATNQLVLAVPAGSRIRSLADLAEPGTKLVVGAAGVPVGDYTRTVLARLPAAQRRAILARVRSNEPDVNGVIGKLAQGAAGAGFVYASDVKATDGRLRAIALPRRLQPTVVYGAAVVSRSKQAAPARRYLDGLVRGRCASALREAGFGAPGGR